MFLRLFDMKSVNTFSSILDDENALVRAMKYTGEHAAEQFLDDYREMSATVHSLFISTLNEEQVK